MREWLRKQRQHKGYTQKALSKAVMISRCYYTNIENGKRHPSVKTAQAIAKILNFDWRLFYEDGEQAK